MSDHINHPTRFERNTEGRTLEDRVAEEEALVAAAGGGWARAVGAEHEDTHPAHNIQTDAIEELKKPLVRVNYSVHALKRAIDLEKKKTDLTNLAGTEKHYKQPLNPATQLKNATSFLNRRKSDRAKSD